MGKHTIKVRPNSDGKVPKGFNYNLQLDKEYTVYDTTEEGGWPTFYGMSDSKKYYFKNGDGCGNHWIMKEHCILNKNILGGKLL